MLTAETHLSKLNLVELADLFREYHKKGDTDTAHIIYEYIKEHYGNDYIE